MNYGMSDKFKKSFLHVHKKHPTGTKWEKYYSPDFWHDLFAIICIEDFRTIGMTLPCPKYLESFAQENSFWHITLNNTLNPCFNQLDSNQLKNSAGGLVQRLSQDDTLGS